MDLFSALVSSVFVFIGLVANAFTKIMLMLAGVIIAFLTIPQSRTAAMFAVAVISAFAGGLLIEGYSAQGNWTVSFAMSVAFAAGFFVYPFLTFFRKFNELVNQDKEIVELFYNSLKEILVKFLRKK